MLDERTILFEQHRRTLEGIAYRMLGTLADAQDIVQETYLKWCDVDVGAIQSPRAWLMTVCSRTALNQLKSARLQREVYVGEWLPEPFPDESGLDPSAQAELDDTVSVALLLALEALSPPERAAFLLHDVFDLRFDEIAEVLGKTTVHCRQLATRARKRVREHRPRFHSNPEEHKRLLETFIEAARWGDLQGLTSLLAGSVALYSDGGGKAEALSGRLYGASNVAHFFIRVFDRYQHRNIAIRTVLQRLNGFPGILVFEDERLATALTIEVHAGQIHCLYAVRNPDKFTGLPLKWTRANPAPD